MISPDCEAILTGGTIDHGLVNPSSLKVVRPSKARVIVSCEGCKFSKTFTTEGQPHFGAELEALFQVENFIEANCQRNS